jgi:hypothetical protein
MDSKRQEHVTAKIHLLTMPQLNQWWLIRDTLMVKLEYVKICQGTLTKLNTFEYGFFLIPLFGVRLLYIHAILPMCFGYFILIETMFFHHSF